MQALITCCHSSTHHEEPQSSSVALASYPRPSSTPSPDGFIGAEGASRAAAATAAATYQDDLLKHIGELKSAAAAERAQLLDQLDEQHKAVQSLEEKLTSAALAKEQAEELASSLLAEKLAKES